MQMLATMPSTNGIKAPPSGRSTAVGQDEIEAETGAERALISPDIG